MALTAAKAGQVMVVTVLAAKDMGAAVAQVQDPEVEHTVAATWE